jgi:hypothetical protein
MQDEPRTWDPVYHFFYGILTQPELLNHVLLRPHNEEPALRPARVIDYELASWSGHRTLLCGQCGSVVEGFAYQVAFEVEEERLAYYETEAYEARRCIINVTDCVPPTRIHGKTFKYAGKVDALRKGRFDRTLWVKTMGLDYWPQRLAGSTPSAESGYGSVSGNEERESMHLESDLNAHAAAQLSVLVEIRANACVTNSPPSDVAPFTGCPDQKQETAKFLSHPQRSKPRLGSRVRALSKRLLSRGST